MKKITLELLQKAGIRALWTFLQTAIAMITIGATVTEVQWLHILSVGFVAALLSFMKSIAAGLPEVGHEGTLFIDKTDPERDIFTLDIYNLAGMETKQIVRLIVDPKVDETSTR
jgi:hypothetical protein